MRHPLSFYQDLQTIRLTASVLYDRGRSLDRSHEELVEDIAPLHERKKLIVKDAIEHDLGGVICAIKQLESDAKAHLETAKFLQQKAEDSRQHARELLDSIKQTLQENERTEAMSGDFSVTLVNGEVTIR